MSIYQQLDDWITTADTQIPQILRRQKAQLYAKGVKSKLRQAEYSLMQLTRLSEETDDATITTGTEEPSVDDQISFHCDTFFAVLYSSMDILAQVVNQSLILDFPEEKVDFKKVAEKLNNPRHHGSSIQTKVGACYGSPVYRNIKKYRNCSTHRRQICIWRKPRGSLTDGYTTSTGPFGGVERFLCDNPLDITPHFADRRKIPDYFEETQTRLHKHISKIIKQLTPIKRG